MMEILRGKCLRVEITVESWGNSVKITQDFPIVQSEPDSKSACFETKLCWTSVPACCSRQLPISSWFAVADRRWISLAIVSVQMNSFRVSCGDSAICFSASRLDKCFVANFDSPTVRRGGMFSCCIRLGLCDSLKSNIWPNRA